MKLTLSFLATGVMFFAWGYGVGKTVTPPKVCPEAQGQKVVSTYRTEEGHFCTYGSGYGQARRVAKL